MELDIPLWNLLHMNDCASTALHGNCSSWQRILLMVLRLYLAIANNWGRFMLSFSANNIPCSLGDSRAIFQKLSIIQKVDILKIFENETCCILTYGTIYTIVLLISVNYIMFVCKESKFIYNIKNHAYKYIKGLQ